MGGGCLLQPPAQKKANRACCRAPQETSSCPKALAIIRALHNAGHAGRTQPRRFLELIRDDFLTQVAEELTKGDTAGPHTCKQG